MIMEVHAVKRDTPAWAYVQGLERMSTASADNA
jgi:hypothetical protein